VNTVHDLELRGVGSKVISGHGAWIDTTTPAGKNTAMLLEVANHSDDSEDVNDRLREFACFFQFGKVVPLVQKTHAQIFCKVVSSFAFAKSDNMPPHHAILLYCLFGVMKTV
jgi:hypothetical protein